MSDFLDTFFSPLGPEWCLYYFILLVLAFISLVFTTFTSILSLFTAKKLTFLGFYNNSLFPVFTSLVIYFLARLTYSICVGSL